MATPEELQASINQINAELAAMRQARGTSYLAGFPKWVVVGIALWVAAIETADKLPQLMLTYPRYEAALAEAKTKIMQPELLAAQIAKAKFDAEAAQYLPEASKAQLSKAQSDAVTASFAAIAAPKQPDLVTAQLEKAQNDAKASALAPQLNAMNLAKTTLETQAAIFLPKTNELQLAKLGIDTKTAVYTQTAAAAKATTEVQGAALGTAAMASTVPMMNMLNGLMKSYGINLPMPDYGAAGDILDSTARLNDLRSAMPNNGTAPKPQTQQAANKPVAPLSSYEEGKKARADYQAVVKRYTDAKDISGTKGAQEAWYMLDCHTALSSQSGWTPAQTSHAIDVCMKTKTQLQPPNIRLGRDPEFERGFNGL